MKERKIKGKKQTYKRNRKMNDSEKQRKKV